MLLCLPPFLSNIPSHSTEQVSFQLLFFIQFFSLFVVICLFVFFMCSCIRYATAVDYVAFRILKLDQLRLFFVRFTLFHSS